MLLELPGLRARRAVAVAPAPPPAFEPYVMVTVDPAVSVMAEMVTTWPATATVPALDVV